MKEAYNDIEERKFEDMARELRGYDDAALLQIADKAEDEWQQEKESHPDRAAKMEEEDDLKFDILMSRLSAEGLKPVSERGYRRKQKWNNRDVARIRKIKRKVVVLAAAAVLVIGGSIGVAAKNGFQYRSDITIENQNRFSRYNVEVGIGEDSMEKAYAAIKKKFDIPVLVLNYIPDGMRFEKMMISDRAATIELTYHGVSFFVKEEQGVIGGSSYILTSDRKNGEELYNKWIDRTIYIEKNKLEDGTIEYSSSIGTSEGYYYLSGIMEKDEFIEIVRNLSFL